MLRRIVSHKNMKWSLIFVTAVFGILPGSCETFILRLVTPLLI